MCTYASDNVFNRCNVAICCHSYYHIYAHYDGHSSADGYTKNFLENFRTNLFIPISR